MRPVFTRRSAPLLLTLFVSCVTDAGAESFNWTHYGASAASTKFAPLDQIDSTNVDQLRVLWRWRSSDFDIRERETVEVKPVKNVNTPLFVDGVLYTSTPLNLVAALDAVTGRQLWEYDP